MKTSQPISSFAVLAACLAGSGAATGQFIEPEVIARDAQPAPGVEGDFVMLTSQPRFLVLDDAGRVALLVGLSEPGVFTSGLRGLFTVGAGQPLINIADNVTDMADAESGPVDITGIFAEVFDATVDAPRINSDGSVDFYATTRNTVVLPSGNTSNIATLRGDGSGNPSLVARQDGDLIATGDPIVLWHDVDTSPDGASAVLRFAAAGSPSSIWTAANGAVGSLFFVENDPAVEGVPAPADWLDWTVDGMQSPVVSNTGRIAFLARLRDAQGTIIDQQAPMIGEPGVGRAPLYDPRLPEAALAGMPADETVETINLLGITTNDDVIVRAEISNFGLNPLAQRGDGLWSIDPSGVGTPLLLEGSPAPFMDPGDVIEYVSARRAPGGRVAIAAGAGGLKSGLYTIDNDGTFALALRSGAPVLIPGRPGGPFTLLGAGIAPFVSADGQLLFVGLIEGASGAFDGALLYTDPAGNVRPVLTGSDTFDFEPDTPGGEGSSLIFEILDMNAAGDAVVQIRSSVSGGDALATFSIAGTPCFADTNNDGSLTPADFNAWILAFNSSIAACDQNSDGLCTPGDFNAWILNFNAGC